MPINNGVVEGVVESGAIVVRIYYDATLPIDQPQPLVDGPRGFCFDVTNTSGKVAKVGLTLPDGAVTALRIGQGDPVTSGPVSGRSRTAAQLALLGYRTRADVAGFSLDSE